jgi:hypothetical protein
MRFIFLIIFSSSLTHLFGQETIALGEWESYLPYQNAEWVTQSKDQIIYSTEWSVFTIDKEDNSVRFLSKTNGLNDVGVNRIDYDSFSKSLLIVYDNSNLDVIVEDEVFNLSDILNNNNIQGDRTINHVFMDGKGNAYLSTSFGITILNLVNLEFGATIRTNQEVYEVHEFDGFLFAATPEGAYRVINDGSINVQDFSAWNLLDDSNGLPFLEPVLHISSYGGSLYISTDDKIYKGSSNLLELWETLPNGELVQYFSQNPNYLMIGIRNQSAATARTVFVNESGETINGGANCINRLLYGVVDERGRAWYADSWEEVRYTETLTDGCKKMTFDSPRTHTASDISVRDGEVYYASGGVSDGWLYLNSRDGFYRNSEEGWTNYNQDNLDPIRENDLLNIFAIEADPTNDDVYIGSYWGGLLRFNPLTNESEHFDQDNSSLQGAIGDLSRTRVAGMAFDEDHNLWISNFLADEPLSVLSNEGTWHSFPAPTSNTSFEEMAIDDNGYKWIIAAGNSGGVVVYDEGESIQDPTDDRSAFFNLNNSEISTNLVYSVAVDLDGDVWVGTAEGPVVFECGRGIFDNPECRGARRTVLQDSIPALLLETEEIRTIAVDGANRKWFGTRRGIFVQSPDGEIQVGRYTVDNSPLFDNVINKMTYDHQSGKMHIATDKGMQAIRTATTGGDRRHDPNNVYAFPNPVRPEYTGEIAIRGLATDANVKITDLNGRLVYETTALGGQAIWDGRDYSGNRATTGVYLVFSSAAVGFDSQDSYVTKILIVD